MTTIRQIEHYAEIMFAFEPKIRYFVEVESAEGVVFCAYEAEEPIGLVCLRKQINAFDIAYLYTKEAHRRQGIASRLMDHAVDYAKKQDKSLRFRILKSNEYAPVCMAIAHSLNMKLSEEMIFFALTVNAESKRAWEEYRPRALEMIVNIKKKMGNHQIISFDEADPVVLNRLRDKIGKELPGLNPFALLQLNTEFSFLLLQGSEPIAFNAVRTIGNKMIFEISSAQKGMSIIEIVPVFFNKLFDSPIERVTCMVCNYNQAGLNHVKKRFGFLFKEHNRQIIYVIYFHSITR